MVAIARFGASHLISSSVKETTATRQCLQDNTTQFSRNLENDTDDKNDTRNESHTNSSFKLGNLYSTSIVRVLAMRLATDASHGEPYLYPFKICAENLCKVHFDWFYHNF